MSVPAGSEGLTRKSTADWAIDTKTYLQGERLLDIDTGEQRVSSGGTYAQAWKALPYLSYVAILSQSETSAPVANVLDNRLGGTVVWARSDTGIYTATLAGAFTVDKTWVQPVLYGLLWGNEWSARMYPDNANTINLLVTDFEGNLTDGFKYLAIEVRVYPA